MCRRALDQSLFLTNWSYVDHLVLPPGLSEGQHRLTGVEEVCYVITGDGEVTVGSEMAPIRKGDAVPLQLNDPHAFRNTGKEDLEFMILGVAVQKGVLDVQEMSNVPRFYFRGLYVFVRLLRSFTTVNVPFGCTVTLMPKPVSFTAGSATSPRLAISGSATLPSAPATAA